MSTETVIKTLGLQGWKRLSKNMVDGTAIRTFWRVDNEEYVKIAVTSECEGVISLYDFCKSASDLIESNLKKEFVVNPRMMQERLLRNLQENKIHFIMQVIEEGTRCLDYHYREDGTIKKYFNVGEIIKFCEIILDPKNWDMQEDGDDSIRIDMLGDEEEGKGWSNLPKTLADSCFRSMLLYDYNNKDSLYFSVEGD